MVLETNEEEKNAAEQEELKSNEVQNLKVAALILKHNETAEVGCGPTIET